MTTLSGYIPSTPCGYQQITNVSAAVGLTVPTTAPQNPIRARIIPLTQAVRWRDDGTDPSATVGMPLAAGTELIYEGDLKKIKFFEQAASAQLNVAYYY
jgi:hypothetical protein